MTDERPMERILSWPHSEAPGRYLIVCSCGRWSFEGSVKEIDDASRAHDDSPWRKHIVSIRGRFLDPS